MEERLEEQEEDGRINIFCYGLSFKQYGNTNSFSYEPRSNGVFFDDIIHLK